MEVGTIIFLSVPDVIVSLDMLDREKPFDFVSEFFEEVFRGALQVPLSCLEDHSSPSWQTINRCRNSVQMQFLQGIFARDNFLSLPPELQKFALTKIMEAFSGWFQGLADGGQLLGVFLDNFFANPQSVCSSIQQRGLLKLCIGGVETTFDNFDQYLCAIACLSEEDDPVRACLEATRQVVERAARGGASAPAPSPTPLQPSP